MDHIFVQCLEGAGWVDQSVWSLDGSWLSPGSAEPFSPNKDTSWPVPWNWPESTIDTSLAVCQSLNLPWLRWDGENTWRCGESRGYPQRSPFRGPCFLYGARTESGSPLFLTGKDNCTIWRLLLSDSGLTRWLSFSSQLAEYGQIYGCFHFILNNQSPSPKICQCFTCL